MFSKLFFRRVAFLNVCSKSDRHGLRFPIDDVLMPGYMYASLKQIAPEQPKVYCIQWSRDGNPPCEHRELDCHRSVDPRTTRWETLKFITPSTPTTFCRPRTDVEVCGNRDVSVRSERLKLPRSDVQLWWVLVWPYPPTQCEG